MNESEWLSSTDPAAMAECARKYYRGFLSGDPLASGRKLRHFACACCRSVWHLLTDGELCRLCKGRGESLPKPVKVSCPMCFGTGRINRSRRAVEVAERYADGEATAEELAGAWAAANGYQHQGGSPARLLCQCARDCADEQLTRHIYIRSPAEIAAIIAGILPEQKATQAALLRDIFGNPWRPVRLCDGENRVYPANEYPSWLDVSVLRWNDRTVPRLAEAAYEQRTPDGFLDPVRLAVLADALELAGCDNEDMLQHLRGWAPKIRSEMMGLDQRRPARKYRDGWVRSDSPHVRGCWVIDCFLGKE